MGERKTIKLNSGREAVLQADLAERPALGAVVAVVHLKGPWWPSRRRWRLVKFLDGLVAAFRIRARDEADLSVVGKGKRVVVRRRLPDGSTELRFERSGAAKAILYCDRRELENLYALGVLKEAKVYWPNKSQRR